MIRAAWLYYHHNMTHHQIAQRLHLSRVKITRMLQKARETGVVEIKINYPLPISLQLSEQLEEQFGLKEAVIVSSKANIAETLDEIGRTAVEHLMQSIFPGCRLGFVWSSTLSKMSAYFKPPSKPVLCTVCDLAGSMLGQDNPYSVSAKAASVLGVPFLPMPVPAVVQSETARDAILSEPSVQVALDLARRSDIAFMGLGDTGEDSTMVRTGYLTADEMADLRARGAVGDIAIHYFDIQGQHIPHPIDERIIGLEWDDLRSIPYLVVVAAGPKKVESLLGILRSRLCHCLITDTNTAQSILAIAR